MASHTATMTFTIVVFCDYHNVSHCNCGHVAEVPMYSDSPTVGDKAFHSSSTAWLVTHHNNHYIDWLASLRSEAVKSEAPIVALHGGLLAVAGRPGWLAGLLTGAPTDGRQGRVHVSYLFVSLMADASSRRCQSQRTWLHHVWQRRIKINCIPVVLISLDMYGPLQTNRWSQAVDLLIC